MKRSEPNIFRHEAGVKAALSTEKASRPSLVSRVRGKKKSISDPEAAQLIWQMLETFRCDNYTPGIVMHQNRQASESKQRCK